MQSFKAALVKFIRTQTTQQDAPATMGIVSLIISMVLGETKWYWAKSNSSAASVTKFVLKPMLQGTKMPPKAPAERSVNCQNFTHSIIFVFSQRTQPCSKFKDSWGLGLGVFTKGWSMYAGWKMSFSSLNNHSIGVPTNQGWPRRSATYSNFSSGLTSTSYLYPLWLKFRVTGRFLRSSSHCLMCLNSRLEWNGLFAMNLSSFAKVCGICSFSSPLLLKPKSCNFGFTGPLGSMFVSIPGIPFLQGLSKLLIASHTSLCTLRSFLKLSITSLQALTSTSSWYSSSSLWMYSGDFGS